MSTHNFKQLEYGQTEAERRQSSNCPEVRNQKDDREKDSEETKRGEQVVISKMLRKLALWEIRVLPIFASFMVLITLFFSYFDAPAIYGEIIEEVYYTGIMAMFFTLSYLFKFCGYHRLFLWYVLANHYIALYDETIGIPVEDTELLIFYLIVAGCFFLAILRSYLKHKSHESK